MIICFVDLWVLITGKGGHKLAHRMTLIALPFAIYLHTTTAFVLALNKSRELWNSAVMVPIFLTSATASGIALLMHLRLHHAALQGPQVHVEHVPQPVDAARDGHHHRPVPAGRGDRSPSSGRRRPSPGTRSGSREFLTGDYAWAFLPVLVLGHHARSRCSRRRKTRHLPAVQITAAAMYVVAIFLKRYSLMAMGFAINPLGQYTPAVRAEPRRGAASRSGSSSLGLLHHDASRRRCCRSRCPRTSTATDARATPWRERRRRARARGRVIAVSARPSAQAPRRGRRCRAASVASSPSRRVVVVAAARRRAGRSSRRPRRRSSRATTCSSGATSTSRTRRTRDRRAGVPRPTRPRRPTSSRSSATSTRASSSTQTTPLFFKFGRPTNEACLACHEDDWSTEATRTAKVPHPAHLRVASETRDVREVPQVDGARRDATWQKHKTMPFSRRVRRLRLPRRAPSRPTSASTATTSLHETASSGRPSTPRSCRRAGTNGCLESCHEVEQCQQCHTTGKTARSSRACRSRSA